MKDAESVYEEMKRDLAEAHRAGGLLERNWLREMKWREAAEAQRDALLAALRELVRLKAVKDDMEARIAASGPPVNWPVCVHTAMADYKSNNTAAWDAARLAIAKATAGNGGGE